MVTVADLRQRLRDNPGAEYCLHQGINLYKTPDLQGLVTQAAEGRFLHIVDVEPQMEDAVTAVAVRLREDNYPGWISPLCLSYLRAAATPYCPVFLTREAIAARLSAVMSFTQAAMDQPNQYLWGGTIGPDYDCSGLMQAAFAAAGVRLPRDSYQQEAFTEPIELEQLQPGDLIFFGQPRTNHVALYLGKGRYIHSSGRDQGRNGIGIDSIWDLTDPISHAYAQTLRGAGRVMASYQPPMP